MGKTFQDPAANKSDGKKDKSRPGFEGKVGGKLGGSKGGKK